MNRDEKIDIIEETAALVRTSLSPPYVMSMGEGSVTDNHQRAAWRSAMQDRWRLVYRAAAGVSPEAIRILHVIGAEHGFMLDGKRLYMNGSGDVRWAEDESVDRENAREEAIRLAEDLPRKFRTREGGCWADVDRLSAAVLKANGIKPARLNDLGESAAQ